jgi:hypothetical protein
MVDLQAKTGSFFEQECQPAPQGAYAGYLWFDEFQGVPPTVAFD